MATTKEICKVCGSPMESAICHQCGWTPVLFPARVPKAISDFEAERLGIAKEMQKNKKELSKQEEKLKKQEEDYYKVSSQLSKACNTLKEQQEKLKTAEAKRKADGQEIDRLNDELEKERKSSYATETEQRKQLSELQNQLSAAIYEKEGIKNQLNDEQNAHKKTKQQVKQLEEKIKNLSSPKNTDNQTGHTPQPQYNPCRSGKPKATISISRQNFSKNIDLYEGNNPFFSPQDINSSFTGQLFNIAIEDSVCTLYDLCGQIQKANGRKVRAEGDLLFDGDLFTIDSIKCVVYFID